MLGIDLVHLPEFAEQLTTGGDLFLRKAFHTTELRSRKLDHLGGVWAAKEAVVKAGALTPGNWLDIRITYDADGRPRAYVGLDEYELSIAHHGDYAVAVAQKAT